MKPEARVHQRPATALTLIGEEDNLSPAHTPLAVLGAGRAEDTQCLYDSK